MLLEKIKNDLKEALKAKDEARVSTLRFLLSAIHNKEIVLRCASACAKATAGKQVESLKDEEVIGVIQKQIKQRKESIEAFKTGKRDDLVKKEQGELEILNNYLPQQISQGELTKVVEEEILEIGATGPGDFGKVMGGVMAKVKGQAEGQIVAKIVKEKLGQSA